MLQLLSPEQVPIADTDAAQRVGNQVKALASQTPTPAQELLQSIRIGWRDVAAETARNIQRLSQATVEQALEMGQQLWRMQRDLKRKEYSTFLSVLGWASAKARKFINLAKVFSGFEPSQLIGIEITTLLSLCSKRYSAVVDQLREVQDITQQLVEQLIKDTCKPRAPKQEPISGWKQTRSGGGRYYNVLLHSESAGLSIERMAESEAILPHRVIEEAVALREQHKSGSVQPNEYYRAQLEELHEVVNNARELEQENRHLELELSKRDHLIASLEAKLASGVVPLVVEADAIATPEATVPLSESNQSQQLSPAQALDSATPGITPRDRFCNKADSLQQHRHLSRSTDYLDQGCPLYYEKLLPANITESYPESRYANDSHSPEQPADDPEPEPTSQYLEPELPRDRFCNKADDPQQHRHLSHHTDYSDKGRPLYYEKLLPLRSQVEQPESPKSLELGDLVQINATSDRTWNGLSGYIQKLSPATGKAAVLLQGDYRSKQFFLNELLLVHQGVQPPEPVEETNPDAIPQSPSAAERVQSGSTTTVTDDAVAQEPVEPASLPEASDDSATSKQPLAADWDMLQQLRNAEGCLRQIDAQIQNLNSKLAQSGLNTIVEREVKPLLKQQLDLRSTTVEQIVALIDSNFIPAYYEEQQNEGRVVLDRKYASDLLLQAQSWADVVLVSGSDRAQLVNAVKEWSKESKQLLVQLLSSHLKTEPDAFEQIDWLPKKLLSRALSSLSFTVQKIKKSDNLVDEPQMERLTGLRFESFSNLAQRHEQWVFNFEGNFIPVFGRAEFEVEKF